MKERVITFGDDGNLVGILTEPDELDKKSGAPCVLILNAGILHHVGPYRLHVIAARRFADQGYVSLRFDVAGIGDSLSLSGKGYDEERVILDIQSAMDAMCKKKSITDFILMGLCTGAANAHRVAIVDDRVKGGVFLDGYSYPTWRFYLRRYLPVLLDPLRLRNMLLRMVNSILGNSVTDNEMEDTPEDFGWWTLPSKNVMRKNLVDLVDRDVNLLYIYSGGQSEVYNYQNQFIHAFSSIDFKGRLKVLINEEAGHTYKKAMDRDRLIDQILEWLHEHYAS